MDGHPDLSNAIFVELSGLGEKRDLAVPVFLSSRKTSTKISSVTARPFDWNRIGENESTFPAAGRFFDQFVQPFAKFFA